ncbi:MAG: proline racemase family protein [Myxococcota bacterium]
MSRRIQVIDSHTEGEPTRVVVAGGPALAPGPARARAAVFEREYGGFRSTLLAEPRGFPAMVGALLLPPDAPEAVAQVLFFNNVGTLPMCVHGMLGVGRTLAHLGRIEGGIHRVETPAGDVHFTLEPEGTISVDNVPSRRVRRGVTLQTADHGPVTGDVAWGGNWFFLVDAHDQPVTARRIPALTAFARDIRGALERAHIAGDDGRPIDHVEIFGPPERDDADSKSFVLCPGGEYDRSPCGTGTSAKLACLYADGRLAPGQRWRQESVIGSVFEGSVRTTEAGLVPTIRGGVWITGETVLVVEGDDPYAEGIRW